MLKKHVIKQVIFECYKNGDRIWSKIQRKIEDSDHTTRRRNVWNKEQDPVMKEAAQSMPELPRPIEMSMVTIDTEESSVVSEHKGDESGDDSDGLDADSLNE